MSIYIGNTKIGQMYLGSTEIAQAYLGSTKVYQNGLPSGYTQIDYISNAARGILTNVQTVGSTWEIEVQMDAAPASTQLVICSDDYSGHYLGARTNGVYGLSSTLTFGSVTDRSVFEVSFTSKTITATCNGVTHSLTNSSSREHQTYISLLDDMNYQHYCFKGKCFGVKCTSGGSFNGVPAQRDSDSHQGLYDMANGVFYDLS